MSQTPQNSPQNSPQTENFLLEILSEELPSSFQALGEEILRAALFAQFDKAGLKYDANIVTCFSTPRRLAIFVPNLPVTTPEIATERKGPRQNAPAAALEGFVRSAGLASIDQAELRDGVYFATQRQPGRPTLEVLPEWVVAAMLSLRWPKSMRWSDGMFAYPRPIRNILAMFGDKVLAGGFHIGHRAWQDNRRDSGHNQSETLPHYALKLDDTDKRGSANFYRFRNVTFGHRFLANREIAINHASDSEYLTKLSESGYVMTSRQERGQKIVDLLYKAGLETSLTVSDFFDYYEQNSHAGVDDLAELFHAPLVQEVTGLVEYPVAYLGSIDREYFDLPPPVIAATIRKNQKYFLLQKSDNAAKFNSITPQFVIISNQNAADGGAKIIAGNERVARARLADARFYWDLDRKSSLDGFNELLQTRAYHAKLGSMADKTQRLQKLSEFLCQKLGYAADVTTRAVTASRYAKADLSSGMVGEFPELQGIMGQYYAREQGIDAKIAAAIGSQYALGTMDGLADNGVGQEPEKIVLALADNLDGLVGFFGIGEKPTGSKDPFALRRAALAVIRLIYSQELSLNLREILTKAAEFYRNDSKVNLDKFSAQEILDFLSERLQSYVLEFGFPKSVFIPIFAPLNDVARDLLLAAMRVRIGDEIVMDDDFLSIKHRYIALNLHETAMRQFIPTWRRVANILRDAETKDKAAISGQYRADLLVDKSEQDLVGVLGDFIPALDSALVDQDFSLAMLSLTNVVGPLDQFFTSVAVNDQNPDLRKNRLQILAVLRHHMLRIADFSQILPTSP